MRNNNISALIQSDDKLKNISRSSNHFLHAIVVVSADLLYANEFCKDVICNILNANNRPDLVNKVKHGSFIDLTEISGEDSIKVSDIAPIIEKSYEKGIESDQKFCIINCAEILTVEAQNKLLKTLEEPSTDQYFFFCTSSRFLLLPTILSRCTIVELEPIEKQKIEQYISEEAKEFDVKTLAELSLGSIDKIHENAKIYSENFDIAFRSLIDIKSSANTIIFATKLQKSNLNLVINYLEQLITDALKLKNGIESIWFESKRKELNSLDCTQKGLLFIYKEIQKIKQQIKYNVSQTILSDRLALSIAEGKHKND